MSDPETDPSRRSALRCPRWVVAVLVLSLTVNLALLGVWAGRQLQRMDRDPELGRIEARMLRLLPEESRAEGRRLFLERRDEVRATRRALGEVTRRALAALRAEPFDRARLEAVLAERRALLGRRFGIVYDRLVEVIDRMSPAERARMADRIERRVRARPGDDDGVRG